MEINIRHADSVLIAEIKGILDTGTSEEAQNIISSYIEQGHKKFVINLEHTEYMSSSGLRVLLSTAKKLWAAEGTFRICAPNKLVKDILDTSGFSVIMDVVESEEVALKGM